MDGILLRENEFLAAVAILSKVQLKAMQVEVHPKSQRDQRMA